MHRLLPLRTFALAAATLLAACGGGGSNNTTAPPPTQTGTISLAASVPSLTVAAGAGGTVTLTIARGNGYTGTVSLSVSGAPSGVTVSLAPSQLDVNTPTSTLTVSASSTAAAGTATLTVQATGSGVTSQSTTVQLTITQPTLSIALSPSALSIAAGATGVTTVAITRGAGLSGPVALVMSGQPAGVTGTFSPNGTTATSSTLTIAVGGSVAAGTYNVTVGATNGPSTSIVTLKLTVTPAVAGGPFSLSLSVTSYLAMPSTPWNFAPTLTITRNPGFTGPVAVSVSGLPIGLVVGATPTNVTGNTSTILVLNAGASNGTYPVTITGVGGGGSQKITVPITIAPASTGAITWKMCTAGIHYPTHFFAVKDGGGQWTRIAPGVDDKTYSFDINSSTASVALVAIDSGVTRTTVWNYTRQEIQASAQNECVLWPDVTQRTATGQMTGVAQGELAIVGMGWWLATNLGGGYSLQNLPAGPLDLFAFKTVTDAQLATTVLKGIVRRGLNPASGGANTLIDFNSAEAFVPTSSTWTFNNTNGEAFGVTQSITSANGTTGYFHVPPQIDRTPTTRTLYGLPAAQAVATDLNQVIATIGTTRVGGPTRQVIAYATTLANKTIDFGPALPTPTVTSAQGAPAGRLRAQGTLPADYNGGVTIDFKSTGPFARFFTIYTTRGYLGAGSSYDVQMPDLTAVLGWDSTWNIRAGDLTNWWVSGGGEIMDWFDTRTIFATTKRRWTGAQTAITAPVDGAIYKMARAQGTIVP